MRTRKFSRILAVLLTLAALMTLSAFAEETEETAAPVETAAAAEEGIEPHASCNGNHTWEYRGRKTYWRSEGSRGHRQYAMQTNECSRCGVLDYEEMPISGVVAHSNNEVSHVGIEHVKDTNTHRVQFNYECVVCGYGSSKILPMSCPGYETGTCVW